MLQPSNVLKEQYIRLMAMGGILLITFMFLFFPRFTNDLVFDGQEQFIMEIEQIPQTQQIDRPPPPARPSVPIESESEDIAEDLTIEETDLENFEAWDAPPPPPSGPQVRFIPYDDPPVATGRIKPVYPDMAMDAGIEGTVIIQAFINKRGRVEEAIVLKGIPNTGLNEAAVEAVRKSSWKPAKQRERAVGVWISIPIIFSLGN